MRTGEMNLRQILEAIRDRPGMYLGGRGKNITILNAYIHGFCDARHVPNVEPLSVEMGRFQTWYQQTYGPEATSLSVASLLLNKYDGDEEKAFDAFFSIWGQYVSGNK